MLLLVVVEKTHLVVFLIEIENLEVYLKNTLYVALLPLVVGKDTFKSEMSALQSESK